MIWIIHLGLGELAAVITRKIIWPEPLLVLLGSLIPDMDSKWTKIGKLTKPVSKIVQKYTWHRGFTHSLFFAATLYLINPCMGIGALSHSLADFLTPKGVQLLWPTRTMFRLLGGPIKRDNKQEFLFFYAAITAAILLYYFVPIIKFLWGLL